MGFKNASFYNQNTQKTRTCYTKKQQYIVQNLSDAKTLKNSGKSWF